MVQAEFELLNLLSSLPKAGVQRFVVSSGFKEKLSPHVTIAFD